MIEIINANQVRSFLDYTERDTVSARTKDGTMPHYRKLQDIPMARTITSDVIAGKILVTALPKIRNAGKNERHSIEKPNGHEKVHNIQLENSLRMQAKPYGMRLVEINDTTVTLEKTY